MRQVPKVFSAFSVSEKSYAINKLVALGKSEFYKGEK